MFKAACLILLLALAAAGLHGAGLPLFPAIVAEILFTIFLLVLLGIVLGASDS